MNVFRDPMNRLFLGAVAVTLAVLSMAHGYSRRDPAAPASPLWGATIDGLRSECDAKSSAAGQYELYARTAREERLPAVAALFRALAASERIHARNCLRSLERLGSRYGLRAFPGLVARATPHNLASALSLERHAARHLHPGAIRAALDEGALYAARVVAWAAGSDVRHGELLERGIVGVVDGYVVCPVCGNTSDEQHADCYCPFCMTPRSEFLAFR